MLSSFGNTLAFCMAAELAIGWVSVVAFGRSVGSALGGVVAGLPVSLLIAYWSSRFE